MKNNNISTDLNGKIDITNSFKFNSTNNVSYEKMITFLNNVEKTTIIGGDKIAENFQNWKSSITEDNMEIIGYENIIEITSILNHKLKAKLKKII